MNPDLPAGDPESQWMWHESYRDMQKNMYRTNYADMTHGREVCMKSDFPSGYGGHIPCLRFDIMHKNTEFDRSLALRRADVSRDAFPSFKDQKDGIPTFCRKPCGAKKNPTLYAIPGDGTTTYVRPPYGQTRPIREIPSYRSVPGTLQKAYSSPALQSGASGVLGGSRHVSMPEAQPSPMGQEFAKTPYPREPAESSEYSSPSGKQMQRTVTSANEEAQRQAMPTEQEILMDQMRSPQFSTAPDEVQEFAMGY
jgi:hypothetical protein